LRRGRTWNETLTVNGAIGTAEHPITIQTYGEGGMPIISGSVVLNDKKWQQRQDQIWSVNVEKDFGKGPLKIFVGQKPLKGEHQKWSLDELHNEWDWFYQDDTLYLNSKSNPANVELSIEANQLHYSIYILASKFVIVRGLVATRSRNGLFLDCERCDVNSLSITGNSLSGVIIHGSENVLKNVTSSENGLFLQKNGKSERKGHGFEIYGGRNRLLGIVAEANVEDGIQFTETADSLNVIDGATLKGNGENCVDVKNGNQTLIGGTMMSDGVTSEDCIIAHKTEQTLKLIGVRASSTTDGPALSVFQGARIDVRNSVFNSELSSAIYIDKSAGNGSTIFNNTIGVGGSRSGAVVDFQGGKEHRFDHNLIKHESDVKPLRIVNGSKVVVSENKIEVVQ
jgi:hypothetical protein